MSVDATKWALQADVECSAAKAVLLALAYYVRVGVAEWTAFASIEHLASVTHLNRKTVLKALGRLRACGAIRDTGTKAGTSRSSPVYRLCPDTYLATVLPPDRVRPPAGGFVSPSRPLPSPDPDDLDVEDGLVDDRAEDASARGHAVDQAGLVGIEPGQLVTLAQLGHVATWRATHGHGRAANDEAPPAADAIVLSRAAQPEPAGGGDTRLPDTWHLPEAWRAWTRRERPSWTQAQVDQVAGTFHAYYRQAPGGKGLSSDWFASWRLWVFRERAAEDAGTPWYSHWSGIVEKGKALGITQAPGEPDPAYRARVHRAAGVPLPH